MDNMCIIGVGRGRYICEINHEEVGTFSIKYINIPSYYRCQSKEVRCCTSISFKDTNLLQLFFNKYKDVFCEDNHNFFFLYNIDFWEKFFNKKSIKRNYDNFNSKIYKIKF